MCGIAGVVARRADFESARSRVDAILDWQAPRGPDGRSTADFVTPKAGIRLGHNRLAVIDLSSTGRQPMADAVGEMCITYNGEIYNYIELRRELELLGTHFRSTSDTEVILAAWRQWGELSLERLNGMFAFALFDARNCTLTLVRDRFGVKPLFWASLDRGVIFASSVMVLAKICGAEPNLEYCAKGAYFLEYERGNADSPFIGVNAVASASLLTIDCRSDDIRPVEKGWYAFRSRVERKAHELAASSPHELNNVFQALLEDAVSVRLRADVPVALSLSGGLDSSMIGALAAAQLGAVEGFSYASPHDAGSEGPLIELYRKQWGLRMHYVWPDFDRAQIVGAFERTLRAQEGPFSGVSVVAQNLVYERAHDAGFKVILGGQGADEALCGYGKFFVFALLHAFRQKRLGEVIPALANLSWMALSRVDVTRKYWRERFRYTSSDASRTLSLMNVPVPRVNLGLQEGDSFLDRQCADVMQVSLPTLLRYEDRNSMQHSVESRLPFMDYRLMELSVALPLSMKIKRGFGKWVLRNAAHGWVPEEIRTNRIKRGFDVGQDWIGIGLGTHLRETVTEGWDVIRPFLKSGMYPKNLPLDEELRSSPNRLAEMILLAWLVSLGH